MGDFLTDYVTEMIGRIDGPMSFRIYLQPLMAMTFALRDGRRDAREGRPPYGWAVLSDPEHRRYLLRDGWKGIARVFIFACVLDLAYQFIVLHGWQPAQALVTAIVLALVPYVLLRGPVNRLMSRKRGRS